MTPRRTPDQQAAAAATPADPMPPGPVPEGPLPSANTGRGRRPAPLSPFGVLVVVLVGMVVAVVALVYLAQRPSPMTMAPPSGIPAYVPANLANLMSLTPVPHQAAPGFTLTDQAGRTMSLSDLRGKVVVLEFMDSHCTDICPLVSQEFVDAYHDLGPAAAKVVFVAVNVNQYHASVADMAAYSNEHGLNSIPSWHFFTGPVAALQAVWRGYHIEVQAPSPNADILHSSALYFISPRGQEAFLASPMADHTASGTSFLPAGQLAAWGRGIALIAGHLAS